MNKVFRRFICLMVAFMAFESFALADNHNLASDPIGSILGYSNLEYAYKLTSHMTVGLSAASGEYGFNDYDFKGTSVGGLARFYFNEALKQDSWYFETSVYKMHKKVTVESGIKKYTGKYDDSNVTIGTGYHWFWKSFNINLGILASSQSPVRLTDQNGNKYKHDVNAQFDIDFNVGWMF